MTRTLVAFLIPAIIATLAIGCSPKQDAGAAVPTPKEIIDLGALVTEDLPERVWGRRIMTQLGFDRNNRFDIVYWTIADGAVSGSNAYYTFFNHGGPHVDAPNHMGLGKGLDSFPVEAFTGPLKVVDAASFPAGRTVTVNALKAHDIRPGDIVLIYTAYKPPATDDETPIVTTLTREAAEYLAELPVRAYGTDAFSVWTGSEQRPVESDLAIIRATPIHHSFLSRGIPIYEQLFNVDQLLNKETMYFVGQPLNIKDGDGMLVRPLVFIY